MNFEHNPFRRMAHRVLQEVDHNAKHLLGRDFGLEGLSVYGHLKLSFFGGRHKQLNGLLRHIVQINLR
ncbi:hypothetical protein D3C76_1677460 [compost metagenome]